MRERPPPLRTDRLHSGSVRRLRGDLEGPDDAAHAADVGDQRDPRHRARRRAARGNRRGSQARTGALGRRRAAGLAQRVRRIRRHAADARDVQAESDSGQGRRGEGLMPAEVASPNQVAIDAAYLVTGICFILGLRYLSSPKTARLGNYISMVGMAIALIATGFLLDWQAAWWIAA